jgi:hypothetical protein
MGQSTDAILVYGFEMDPADESPSFLGEDGDFEDFVTDEAGVSPWRPGMSAEEKHEYFTNKQVIIDACPVELVLHCSSDYPMYIMAIRGTQLRASRGYPEVVKSLSVSQEKITAAKQWCLDHGIEWKEPEWILCSDWG